jgi:hypothetical protein
MELEQSVELPLDIAEALVQALRAALYHSQASDLIDSYRALKANPTFSPMTKQLQTQIDLLQSWIDLSQTKDEEVSDDESGEPE